jgi:hypothetical protein
MLSNSRKDMSLSSSQKGARRALRPRSHRVDLALGKQLGWRIHDEGAVNGR